MGGDLSVIIPAIKKNVAFPDDLVKKLAGRTLLHRAIDRACELVEPHKVYVITDSEEVQLFSEREGVEAFREPSLIWDTSSLGPALYRYLRRGPARSAYVVLLSPYAPLVAARMLREALEQLIASDRCLLVPVRTERRHLFDNESRTMLNTVLGTSVENHRIQQRGFAIFDARVLQRGFAESEVEVLPYVVEDDAVEIESFRDWWICEKLLRRKRIVFRVIGNDAVGFGHIYRALSLAHEITDHEVMFVCEQASHRAVSRVAGYDYWLEIYDSDAIADGIIALKPDLVINDILDTDAVEIERLQGSGSRVVNFEDMGSGARQADLTINELYDEPRFEGDRIMWGHTNFFVRDEFHDAKPHRFRKRVDNLLLTFGGTDQHDMTHSLYQAIHAYCVEKGIQIHIVTGPGYAGYSHLEALVAGDPNTTLTHASGVMSRVMEQCQVAITSNGRTVYELAHMNIPAIVVSQHEREKTHGFSVQDNGFVGVGVYKKEKTPGQVVAALRRLIENQDYRRTLHRNTTRFRFHKNKARVLRRILDLLKNGKRL